MAACLFSINCIISWSHFHHFSLFTSPKDLVLQYGPAGKDRRWTSSNRRGKKTWHFSFSALWGGNSLPLDRLNLEKAPGGVSKASGCIGVCVFFPFAMKNSPVEKRYKNSRVSFVYATCASCPRPYTLLSWVPRHASELNRATSAWMARTWTSNSAISVWGYLIFDESPGCALDDRRCSSYN